MACRLAGKDFDFKPVDLQNAAKNVEFKQLNPTGHFPFIEDGQWRVMGGNYVIFVFLCKNASAVGKALMPEELEGKIRGVVGWE